MKIDFHDILIEPKEASSISSRAEISSLYNKKNLPIIVAPMDTVIDRNNYNKFTRIGLNVCIPRGTKTLPQRKEFETDGDCFYSYGLDEFLELVSSNKGTIHDKLCDSLPINILIDIANGHMDKLHNVVRNFKSSFPNHVLMVGNVANPNTYKLLAEAGADYIRIGIGNGSGCLTTQQTGVGYPMASLIIECFKIKTLNKLEAKIVADGGFKDYSDIIKALAIGADYVMLGGLLNKCLESSGDTYWNGIKLPKFLINYMYRHNFELMKKFRGMSTKEVQKKWGVVKLKTSEGIVKYSKVEYKLEQWTENFISYLKSAMSYTDCRDLESFVGKVKYNIISKASYSRFNK